MDAIVSFRLHTLTETQQRLLRLIAGGATPAEQAVRLGLSRGRLQREVRIVLAVLGVYDSDEATVLWWGSRAGARTDLAAAAQRLVA